MRGVALVRCLLVPGHCQVLDQTAAIKPCPAPCCARDCLTESVRVNHTPDRFAGLPERWRQWNRAAGSLCLLHCRNTKRVHMLPVCLRSCATCGLLYVACPGHFGHVELPVPVYNPLVFMCAHTDLLPYTQRYLPMACFRCSVCSYVDNRSLVNWCRAFSAFNDVLSTYQQLCWCAQVALQAAALHLPALLQAQAEAVHGARPSKAVA